MSNSNGRLDYMQVLQGVLIVGIASAVSSYLGTRLTVNSVSKDIEYIREDVSELKKMTIVVQSLQVGVSGAEIKIKQHENRINELESDMNRMWERIARITLQENTGP